MSNDDSSDRGAPGDDPLEALLADWFTRVILAARGGAAVDSETAYASRLEDVERARRDADSLARTHVARLYARLDQRTAPAAPKRRPRPYGIAGATLAT
jgi:hypothetical protein